MVRTLVEVPIGIEIGGPVAVRIHAVVPDLRGSRVDVRRGECAESLQHLRVIVRIVVAVPSVQVPGELGGVAVDRGVHVHVVDDFNARAILDRIRHVSIPIPVAIVVVTVGVDAVVPGIGVIVGHDGGVVVITIDEPVPAILVAIEIVAVLPVVQGVGLGDVAVRVDSVVAGVRSLRVDLRLPKSQVGPGGPGLGVVDIVQLGTIDAVIAEGPIVARMERCIEPIAVLIKVVGAIAVRVHPVVPGVCGVRMDLVRGRLFKPLPVHDLEVIARTGIIPAVLPEHAVGPFVQSGIKAIPIPIEVIGSITVLVDAVVPDLLCLRKDVCIEIVAIHPTGDPVSVQVWKLPADAPDSHSKPGEDQPWRRSAKAAHRPSKTVGPVAKHPGRLPVAIARDQLLVKSDPHPVSFPLHHQSERSP